MNRALTGIFQSHLSVNIVFLSANSLRLLKVDFMRAREILVRRDSTKPIVDLSIKR